MTNFTGGLGDDTFVLAVGEGTDTIYDFRRVQDVFGFSQSLTFEALTFAGVGTTTRISVGDEVLSEIDDKKGENLVQVSSKPNPTSTRTN